MSELDLDAIETRAKSASQGPWKGKPNPRRGNTTVVLNAEERFVAHYLNPSDAEFIAHARVDVPALVAEVRRLRAVLQDIADHGLHADLNPTAPMHDTGQLYDHLVRYLRRCDAGIREEARRALEAP